MQRSEGDLAQLGETFNRMTYELRTQRDDLVRARDVIDQRRRFTEAVLAGASAASSVSTRTAASRFSTARPRS